MEIEQSALADDVLRRSDSDYIRQVQLIETERLDVSAPVGLAYSPEAKAFLVSDAPRRRFSGSLDVVMMNHFGEAIGSVRIKGSPEDATSFVFDPRFQRLLTYDPGANELIEVPAGRKGTPVSGPLKRTEANSFGLWDPQGLAVDPLSGDLFVLDGLGPRIVHIKPDAYGGLEPATVSEIGLGWAGSQELRGIAFDPTNGNLFVLGLDEQRLYEITLAGLVVSNRDLSEFGLRDPRAMVFAPSGDTTDDLSVMSLYIADGGNDRHAPDLSRPGSIIEFSLESPFKKSSESGLAPRDALGTTQSSSGSTSTNQSSIEASAASSQSSLVQTIDTSQFLPPSPDPAGIAYLSTLDSLLMSDSEVNEIPALFTGDNLFRITNTGNLIETLSTLSYSKEPTGVAYNPINEHLFISDDDANEIYEIDPGPDGFYDTADDIVTVIDTTAFGSGDPEGLAFDSSQGFIYVADGVNSEIYEIAPGANGIFDGVPPAGDDEVSSFDTTSLGLVDPEGITYRLEDGHLYIIGEPVETLAHVTTTGDLLRVIDISVANAQVPAGLTFAPSSVSPSEMNIYVTDRGVDNNSDPNENDGKIYELTLSEISPGNMPPVVDAGPDQSIVLPDFAILDGTVTDDNLPGPPTVTWSQVSGPGTVTFVDASMEDTNASFSTAGTYVLRLTADDGELTASDEATFAVTGSNGETIIEIRVSASSDDAEESASGNVSLTSTDLELVFEGGGDQIVGMRFNAVDIPSGATIDNAFIQFQVDETSTVATDLFITGEATDDAATFVSSDVNISTRLQTAASVPWSPVAWETVGEAGLAQRTPNIASVIQEIVSRPGWSSGNSLVLLISGTGERTAESFDGDPSGAPLLHVDYMTTNTPAAPVIIGIADDTGASGSDGLTNDNDLLVSGTSEAGVTVEVFLDGISLGTTVADGSGNWSLQSGAIADGPHNLTAQASDGLGNNSPLSAVFGITVDTVAPAAPVVTGITEDTGTPGDGVTSDNTLLISGTAEAGATVEVFLDGVSLGAVAADGSGTWSFDNTASVIADGAHALTAQATDGAGNLSALSAAFSIFVSGSVGPGSVHVITPSGSDGYSTTGGRNGRKHLQVVVSLEDGSGLAVAGASVSVTISGPKSSSGTGTTDTLGKATFKFPNAPSGTYSTSVTSVTAAGLVWDGSTPPNSFNK